MIGWNRLPTFNFLVTPYSVRCDSTFRTVCTSICHKTIFREVWWETIRINMLQTSSFWFLTIILNYTTIQRLSPPNKIYRIIIYLKIKVNEYTDIHLVFLSFLILKIKLYNYTAFVHPWKNLKNYSKLELQNYTTIRLLSPPNKIYGLIIHL